MHVDPAPRHVDDMPGRHHMNTTWPNVIAQPQVTSWLEWERVACDAHRTGLGPIYKGYKKQSYMNSNSIKDFYVY